MTDKATGRGIKLQNDYVEALGFSLYDAMPKAVLAAIAVSALTCGGDHLEHAAARVAEEWDALHVAGIVPQKPNKEARAAIAKAEG